MKRFGILFLLFFSVLFFCFKVNVSYASQKSTDSSYISVINLIRGKELGHENDDLLSSFKAQWQVTSERKVNATWLLQYSVLEDNQIMDFAKNKTKNQEFGLLLEIDGNFARKSNVLYRGQGPSYFSDGLLLVSYDLSERKKLIDTSFKKFKSVFGYYPKTVGAWWIGADSISYMQEKYGIVAALKASDQFNLDVYSIWGTPFSIPYLSSKENEGIPADNFDKSSKVVILQWAARDPLLGYQDSTYSIQDYALKGYDTLYAKYLMENYLKNPGSNVVVGLENGGTLNTFQKYYKDMLNLSNNLKKENKAIVSTAKDYANKFLSEKSVFPKNSTLLFKDYKTNDQAFWYNSQNYRIFIQKVKDKIFLSDFRDYSTKVNEDFSFLPNSQGDLKITEPSIIDSVRFSDSKVLLKKNSSVLSVVESKGL
ncbi:MAG TPA: hypothetical protein VES68_00920, partial [Candidatus Sulfotelmatobacter sp.]|nr:hypothetical protein [Candidatus Sulfotelmatobacter sp.]